MREVLLSIRTTGCKVNQADSAWIVDALRGLPVRLVPPSEPADIAVVNACTVTAAADRDGRAQVYRALRLTDGPVFLTGCLAMRLGAWSGPGEGRVRLIPETREREALARELRAGVLRVLEQRRGTSAETTAPHVLPPAALPHARPLVKVQDGCDHACAFCIVPKVRGPSRSVPIPEVLARVKAAAERGAAEVVLTGVDLGAWGQDLNPTLGLADLIEAVLSLGTGMRFRLSSVEPDRLDDRLVDLLASSSDLCPHLHVPVQSGSDRMLRAMRRGLGAQDVAHRLARAASLIPDLTLGLDILCGFPGEEEQDFEATLRLVEALPVTYLHVFPFSPRPGTEAASMGPGPDPGVVRARCAALRELSASRRASRARSQVGQEVEVVDIRRRPQGGVEALSAHYFRVVLPRAEEERAGRYRVRIVEHDGATLVGHDAAYEEADAHGP